MNFIKYNNNLINVAKQMRNNSTKAEIEMWNFLKLNFLDKKFLRQKPLENFIVDFYCASNKIIIEIDGEVHLSQKDKDRERDNIFLQKYKIGTIRFTNNEVFYEKEKIKKVLKGVGGF